ncbi:Putative Tautomerase/MIF superfamily, tautomerase, cis-CaaD [Colletotrichum destructivum]|uniref:Tautomerase/MIF superfamily, tautomerase, cis-CaaD n=1 Tax=Colletotrichum destructivum TaxID=34406 RepID=A0AAX4HZH3_9PEZI|nr:Putative Tautomerase/MIF superfamily, tautomerase, cis-CaaD [Colletotrichum destructivum]
MFVGQRWANHVCQVRVFAAKVRPVLRPKGIRWESNIYETPRFNWRLQEMQPPDFDTDMNSKWIKDNTFTDEDEQEILLQQGYLDESCWKMPRH